MPSPIETSLIALCGGVLGVTFMVPLHTTLVIEGHNVLVYPEGQTCTEALMTSDKGDDETSTVSIGLSASAVYRSITDRLKLFPNKIDQKIPIYRGAGFGADMLPALAGINYICGA